LNLREIIFGFVRFFLPRVAGGKAGRFYQTLKSFERFGERALSREVSLPILQRFAERLFGRFRDGHI